MRATFFGHPIHPMLVVFPLGLWVFSFVCDGLFLWKRAPIWREVAFYDMAGGIAGALLAAVPGLIDLLAITAPPIRRTALAHMGLNLFLVGLFSVNLWLRARMPAVRRLPVVLSAVGALLLGASGWLGGEMVYVHGVGIAPVRTAAAANEGAGPVTRVELTSDLTFRPAKVTIPKGGTVEWRNISEYVHTITADPGKAADPADVALPVGAQPFNSGPLRPGDTYRHTFSVPGQYKYFCIPHETSGMVAEITVEP